MWAVRVTTGRKRSQFKSRSLGRTFENGPTVTLIGLHRNTPRSSIDPTLFKLNHALNIFQLFRQSVPRIWVVVTEEVRPSQQPRSCFSKSPLMATCVGLYILLETAADKQFAILKFFVQPNKYRILSNDARC